MLNIQRNKQAIARIQRKEKQFRTQEKKKKDKQNKNTRLVWGKKWSGGLKF